jgi:hypothetical protein
VEVVPGKRVGPLHFRTPLAEAVRLLGEPPSRFAYGDGRCRYDYAGDISLLFLDEAGLVAVTLGRGPAVLRGRDLFSLTADALAAWLTAEGVGVARKDDGYGDFTLAADIGLFVYFAEGEPGPQSVEVFVGSWEHGVAVSL